MQVLNRPMELIESAMAWCRSRGFIERWELLHEFHYDRIQLRVCIGRDRWKSYDIGRMELEYHEIDRWVDHVIQDIAHCVAGTWREEVRPREYIDRRPYYFGVDFAAPHVDTAADKKAAALFKQTAGHAAYDTLERGEALPITGSKGTAYKLHKKSSYCVERISDGAKLCAVVPNVPLWDHLLGIKLMVERDEDRFLATANVSGGNNERYMRPEMYGRFAA